MSTLHKNLAYRIASILVSLLFVLLAYIFQIPNPMMLLILPVIYFTFSSTPNLFFKKQLGLFD